MLTGQPTVLNESKVVTLPVWVSGRSICANQENAKRKLLRDVSYSLVLSWKGLVIPASQTQRRVHSGARFCDDSVKAFDAYEVHESGKEYNGAPAGEIRRNGNAIS
jgi:hypothetical protein